MKHCRHGWSPARAGVILGRSCGMWKQQGSTARRKRCALWRWAPTGFQTRRSGRILGWSLAATGHSAPRISCGNLPGCSRRWASGTPGLKRNTAADCPCCIRWRPKTGRKCGRRRGALLRPTYRRLRPKGQNPWPIVAPGARMVIPLLLFEAGQRNAGRTAPAVLTPEAFH